MSIDQCLSDPFLILMMFEVEITLSQIQIGWYYVHVCSLKKCDVAEGLSVPESQLMTECSL